jgi:hypothetical protein
MFRRSNLRYSSGSSTGGICLLGFSQLSILSSRLCLECGEAMLLFSTARLLLGLFLRILYLLQFSFDPRLFSYRRAIGEWLAYTAGGQS